MKKIAIKLIPEFLLRFYRKRLKTSFFRNKSPSQVFSEIYRENYWGSSESVSGAGSVLNQTQSLILQLNSIIADFEIKSVLDIPSGDFNWMKKVDLSNVDYSGADIVKEIIDNNNNNNFQSNIKFKVLDLISDSLPESDLIIVRDCLVHLCFKDIEKAINNIKASNSKYLLTTTFTSRNKNHDILTRDWRTINLQKKPFCFPLPIQIINENCTEGDGKYHDKSMALWEISKL
jgi:hypothetical protein